MHYRVVFNDSGRIEEAKESYSSETFLPGHSNVIIVSDAKNEKDAKRQALTVWRAQHGTVEEDNGYSKPIDNSYDNSYIPHNRAEYKLGEWLARQADEEMIAEWFIEKKTKEEKLTMKFEPMNKRLLIKREEADERTPGGLFLPPTSREAPQSGAVKAVSKESGIEVGAKVVFGKYAGTDIKMDGEEYLIIKEEDILGIVTL
jgi:chaperonin GroES